MSDDSARVHPQVSHQSEGERLDARDLTFKAILGDNPIHPALRPGLEARIQNGDTINVLDIACGSGVFARNLIEAYPQGKFQILLTDITDRFLHESAANRAGEVLPKNCHFQAWDLHSDEVPAEVNSFAPEGFDLITSRFIVFVLHLKEWDPFLKRIQELLAPSKGVLQLMEATHTWCVQDDYKLDRSLPPFDRYPYDPVDLARNRGTHNTDNIFQFDRLAALTLVSKLKAAGYSADQISSIPFAVPSGKDLVPSRPLVASSRMTKAGCPLGSVPEENNELAELEDAVDYSEYAKLPGPVETDENKLRQARENAMAFGRSITTLLAKDSSPERGVSGLKTQDEIAQWKEAADAWLEHHTYWHPCVFVAWQPSPPH